jgi:hypothetical protein
MTNVEVEFGNWILDIGSWPLEISFGRKVGGIKVRSFNQKK